ncbi:unnamed protein product [Miscanthus lutarioriparius]|uniref:Exocyst subunit Exo70 family protein n=1 Tax=Miscanthus lutarioriparius TaxID=422564 RepID=A0A811N5Q4_9POAL|nr:unnamed protein product [Miscanthus lutarioriparius]
MAGTLVGNASLDIRLDIYATVNHFLTSLTLRWRFAMASGEIMVGDVTQTRYRRATKAMMRLNPAYLKSYTSEEINAMEWESLESAMALWSPHFHVDIASVLAVERRLCAHVLEPLPRPSLFKQLDMIDAVARERERLDELFSSESATLAAIRERTCEVEHALERAASGVFLVFGLRIDTLYVTDADADVGHVPKIVQYTVNYLKCLASDDYRALIDTALRVDLERSDEDEDTGKGDRAQLAKAMASVLEALHRHVEATRCARTRWRRTSWP